MPDYGHDLRFGAGLPSTTASAAAVVELAEMADRSGVDLLAFADHPYHPGFLDTWTLLSYVAARTTTVRLAASVHPVPLRGPAVLARAAASLDVLSGGRIDLGLGAGHFWDGIEAMGGPRRTPGEAVTALAEGVQVIRALWDVRAPGLAHLHGEHYRLAGAHRGPRPAHDAGIWIGAYKPRMLRLTGRLADGWWPSLPALAEHGSITLAEGNAVVDQAAADAGRSPADIRRLLNLGALLPVQQIAELAIEDGVSVFTVDVSDRYSLEHVARETAPAVRELVAAERRRNAPR
ncbi:LLM class flavin-dependent oxidoreductase [Ruania zhangjianzhongii]|uniref:LLM class flavin-dependent oxidoreductase n=1 Tax=Ruania zhangjianzhongii TaxID=2603206 RepID=UPI0011C9688D|nr:LLM class flavin-dependent oxidoreductase [Ruania zhangjianzhongii]